MIGPSNPVISIGPILAIPGIREALTRTEAPVVAVSPLVGGEVVKGPTAAFMEFANLPLTQRRNRHLLRRAARRTRGRSPDQADLPVLETDVLMATADARRRVAEETLGFALALR